MNKIKYKLKKFFGETVTKLTNKLAQTENFVSEAQGSKVFSDMDVRIRQTAGEGAILLKNDGMLPLKASDKVAVFGRVQSDWFFVGYGSGGDVRAPYKVSLADALEKNGVAIDKEVSSLYREWTKKYPAYHGFWGHWPRFHDEMTLDGKLVQSAAKRADCALVIIGRASGEDRENKLKKGSYYLTDCERDMLEKVSSAFAKTAVILNIGTVMDLSWVEHFGEKINAVLLPWQGGMESGNAVCDLLTGKVSPSGKLPVAIARKYADYPSASCFGNRSHNFYKEDIYVGYRYFETFDKDAVLFPFGFGLSYAQFEISQTSARKDGDNITVCVKVKNLSAQYAGKEVVQLYLSAPQGKLGKASRVLCAFEKTEIIAPQKSADVTLSFKLSDFASYDDGGATGHKSAYVLESGEYRVYFGNSVRSTDLALTFSLSETVAVKQLCEAAAPKIAFKRMRASENDGRISLSWESVPLATVDLKRRILENLPASVEQTGDKGIKLWDVKQGKASMSSFVAQLSDDELEALSRGDYHMNSPLGPSGNAGVFCGVTESLREKGIPAVTATDGPSGIRLHSAASLLPIGMLLASTWDAALIKHLYEGTGQEMLARGTSVLLAPGMNIQRNPLCGRNFEYFSEDPFLSGKIAAAVVKGVQSAGVSACPKHFACNNQEVNRNKNDSRVSERALREIYLKGFEICIKDAAPQNLMTSYNKINGVWGHYHYDLCTTVLRGEWGYKGNVMTDWWMQRAKSPEFPSICDNAYRVRAQADVLMPGGPMLCARKPDGTLLKTLNKPDGITLGELQRSAANILNFAMNSSAFKQSETPKDN
jgi:beta-glucosidase